MNNSPIIARVNLPDVRKSSDRLATRDRRYILFYGVRVGTRDKSSNKCQRGIIAKHGIEE